MKGIEANLSNGQGDKTHSGVMWMLPQYTFEQRDCLLGLVSFPCFIRPF
jgi:hypothetical protein